MDNPILTREPGIAGRFIYTAHDEEGRLTDIRFRDDDHFNFAFDIVDELAREYPKKTAMLHIDRNGRERHISFSDMMKHIHKTRSTFVLPFLPANWREHGIILTDDSSPVK